MKPGLSLYLDVLRFGAALAVVVAHLSYAELSGSMLQYWRPFGTDAVMVFFVLSGFVIAHVAHEKEPTLGVYTVSRLARLWSVAVPALALTVLFDQWGRALDPAAYTQWWYQASDPLWRALRALTFTNQLWFSAVRPFSNGPWWSLGYEAMYYAIFAALFYLRGKTRLITATALMLAAGPKILLLFPVWWLGVWTWKRTRRETLPTKRAAFAFFGSLAAYALLRWSELPVFLEASTAMAIGHDNVAGDLLSSDRFVASYLIGPLVALNFLGAHGLAPVLERYLSPLRKPIVFVAQSTFVLYLLHYPLLRFAKAALAYDIDDPWQVLAVFLSVVGACIVIGPLIERTKRGWKALLSRGFAATAHRARPSAQGYPRAQ